MVYRPSINPELCFVLLPLKNPFLGYFDRIIKPAAQEAGLLALKADDVYGTRGVMKDIWEHIWKARAVVAIVTGKNPNVNYELGICHTLGIPTVLITEKADDVPFDYRHLRYIRYRTIEAGWEQKLKEDVTKTLKQNLSSPKGEEELPWPYDTFDLSISGRIGRLVQSDEARGYVVQGAELVTLSLAPAFGPTGNRVSVTIPEMGRQMPLRRGASIAQRIKSGDPLKAHGVLQMARLAQDILRDVGDGTKTGIFLASSMLNAGDGALRAGHNRSGVLSGMQKAVETACAYLMTEARTVTGENLLGVALSACAFDHSIATAVLDAMRRAGKDGMVQIVDGTGGDLQLDVQEGMHFDRGYLSPMFVTDQERQECVLEDCYILVYERPIGAMKDLLPLMEKIAKSGKPLVIISQDVAGEALATLVVNKQRGILPSVAVKAPGLGNHRTQLLEDIAALTGGRAFLLESSRPLDAIDISDLGKAKKIIVGKDCTTIIGGAGVNTEIANRVRLLRMEISTTTDLRELQVLQERLARLVGAVAVIKAPGRTDEDVADSRYKLGSALNACRSAIENGFVAGGGATLCRAKILVDRLISKDESTKAGINAVSAALAAPLRQILENSKCKNPDAVVQQVLQSQNGNTGFNAETHQVEDLLRAGVLDPARVLRETLTLAFAYTQGTLKTAAWDTTPISEN